jgi:hypothetical protein
MVGCLYFDGINLWDYIWNKKMRSKNNKVYSIYGLAT